jgi:hypothetical protein
MNIAEQYQAGLIAYDDAVSYLVRERSTQLHIATSGKGADPQATAVRRIFAYKQADSLHKQLKQVWSMASTPPEFPEQLNSHRLQSTYKGTALYRTPERFDPEQISHTKLTPDEKFARENAELLNLDMKMARIETLGLLSLAGT